MRAIPPFGDIYLRFREADFGRIRLPGLELQVGVKIHEYKTIDAALRRIRELHDQRLKGN